MRGQAVRWWRAVRRRQAGGALPGSAHPWRPAPWLRGAVRATALALAALGAQAAPAAAETVVASVSSPRIDISSNFIGAEIVVFGVVERAHDEPMPPDGYDVAVVVRGPPQRVASRRKERVAGLWINGASEEFVGVPAFYALDSTRPIDEIAAPRVLEVFRIGLDNTSFGVGPVKRDDPFRAAIISQRTAHGLFRERAGSVSMLTPTFFRVTVLLPKDVPDGLYSVETYVFASKRMVASELSALKVEKVGLEAQIHDMAVNAPLLYGLLIAALALATGWLGGVVFRRD